MGFRAGKIALGLGLITGAITGLLFAPEEGKKIRKKIAAGDTKGILGDMKEMGLEISEMVAQFAHRPSVVEAIDKAKDKAAEVANLKREELDAMLKKANKKADAFKQAVGKYVGEQKALLEEKLEKKTKKMSKKKEGKSKKKRTKKK